MSKYQVTVCDVCATEDGKYSREACTLTSSAFVGIHSNRDIEGKGYSLNLVDICDNCFINLIEYLKENKERNSD